MYAYMYGVEGSVTAKGSIEGYAWDNKVVHFVGRERGGMLRSSLGKLGVGACTNKTVYQMKQN